MFKNLLHLYAESFNGLTRDIWFLSFITFINRSGSVVFLFLSIYLAIEMGFTKTQVSIVMSCHGIGSFSGAYLGGWLTDRIGYYRVMFWSLFSVGFLYFALFWISTFPMFCIMGFVISLVGDAFRPASMASITAYGGIESQTRSMSLYRLAINFGFGFGVAAAGFLATGFGYGVLFFMDGGTCILSAFLFIFFLKEKVEAEEKEEIGAPKIIRHSAYKDGWYLLFVFCWFLNSIVFIQLFYTFPLFCKEEIMMSESGVGMLMSFNGVLIAVLEMPLIFILAKKRDQMGYITWGVVLIGMSFVVFNILGFSVATAIFSTVLFSIGEIVNFPLSSSLALSRSNPNNRGQYMGLFSMSFSVGLILAPQLGFRVAESYGYAVLWNTVGVLAAISTAGLLLLRRQEQQVAMA